MALQLIDPNFAKEKRKEISDDVTSNEYADYGVDFVNPDDAGTAHINVLAPNGDAISVTATINTL